jgi:6-phosphogluconolactonase (cycloisomerase 2 family)
MKRKPCEVALVVVSFVSMMILAACNSGSPVLRYITVSPTSANISVGTTQQFTATGSYSNGGSTSNLAVSWSSSNTAVATINSTSGVATAVSGGTTSITATLSGVTSSAATLSVNQLTSIAVTPANPTISIGATEQFTATGTFKHADGTTSTSDVTAQVTWTPGSTTIATFSTTTLGLATGVGGGTTSVTAALDGVTGTTNLTVGNGPVSLVISPATATIAISNSTAFTVQEKWSDGTMHTPSGTVTWSSSSAAQAGVVSNGAAAALAAGFAAGTPTITATEGTLTGTTALTVVTGSTHYAYISNNADSPPDLGFYTVTASTSPYLTPGTPPTVNIPNDSSQQTVLNPNGKYLYTIDNLSGVWLWNISATGVLSISSQPSQPGGGGDTNVGVIDPYGRFLYVIDNGNPSGTPPVPSTIYAFQISQTDGTLTAVTGSPFTTNLNASFGMIIDHSGQYLYATNSGNGTISAYQIGQTTGALTPLSTGATISTGTSASSPFYAALDPTGTYIYVANGGDNSVASFSIGTGGVLTSLGANLSISGASVIINVVVAPNNKTLYVLDAGTGSTNGQVFGFTLTSGVPGTTPITGTPAATSLGPTGMAIDPTGVLLAVDNTNPISAPPAPPANGSISLFTIGSGGALTVDTPVAAGVNAKFVTFYDAP